jgi:hypothetical protein
VAEKAESALAGIDMDAILTRQGWTQLPRPARSWACSSAYKQELLTAKTAEKIRRERKEKSSRPLCGFCGLLEAAAVEGFH